MVLSFFHIRYQSWFLFSLVLLGSQQSLAIFVSGRPAPVAQPAAASSLSPTEAYLGDAQLKKNVTRFALYRQKAVLAALEKLIIKREKEYHTDFCVFYHAQKWHLRIVQDFLKELYAVKDGVTQPDDYFYLRPRFQVLSNVETNTFIDAAEQQQPIHDGTADMRRNLLCLNLSLFGNASYSGECTYEYFVANSSCCAPGVKSLLKEIFKYYQLDAHYIQSLVALNEKIKTQEGTLFQICIPKDKVDQYVYLSHAYGVPYRSSIISNCFDSKKQRHTNISSILEKYCSCISSIGNADAGIGNADLLQARLVFDQNFLNPASGVKIFRYTTVPNNLMQDYHRELKEIAAKVCHA